MCDTFVAVGKSTKDGSVILGKNSDRQPNEPHHILHVPAQTQDQQKVTCTYITIPQVEKTHEVILSKPQWIWGAEMGVNEHGVAIGNEAVWTTEMSKKESLIGMDFLRLGLERGKTSREALDVITDLLETYGQGGNHGFDKPDYYDNSFIIADPREAWVLETAGKFWIAEKVETIRTISNCLTIENKYDLIHSGLLEYAIESGKCKSIDDFNFRKQFSTRLMPWAAMGDKRRACTLRILEEASGRVTPRTAFNTLRSHNLKDRQDFNPRKSSMASPCLHASSFLTPSQSTGSMVAHLNKNKSVHWFTGTSGPCISIFKPMVTGNGILEFPEPSNRFDNETLWWKHEVLHRITLLNYSELITIYKDEKDALEADIYDSVYNEDLSVKIDPHDKHKQFRDNFNMNLKKIDEWIQKISEYMNIHHPKSSWKDFRYRWYWRRKNKKAEIVLDV